MLSYIWAEDTARNIGYQGQLPWRLPNDLKYFKQLTLGQPIIMGRKTFNSLGRLLPNRLHVVLTSEPDHLATYANDPRVIVLTSPHALKNWIKAQSINQELFVIGGASLFALLADEVDTLYQTKINASFAGDVQMINLPNDEFKLVQVQDGICDEKNLYPHQFLTYQRQKGK